MKFDQQIKNDTFVIKLSGDLIGENSGTNILDAVNNAINDKVLICIIDISELRYINSSGIGVLITILTKFRNKGGEVYLMNPSENVKKLLVITKLNAIFQIVNSVEEVEKLNKK
jgi:anti-sigma B factor antagonist